MLYNDGVNVSASYAKANLPELLKAVEQGKTITISRYNKRIAELAPCRPSRKPARKFGTLKGKIKIIDPNWAAPMSDEEVEAFLAGRY